MNKSTSELSLDQLIEIAKSEDTQNSVSKSEIRPLKELEQFVTELEIKQGRKTVHYLVLYDLYKKWSEKQSFPVLTVKEFNKGISYFFVKKLNSQNTTCFKLSPNYKNGRIDYSNENIHKCRVMYGSKKKSNETISDEISGTRSQSEQN